MSISSAQIGLQIANAQSPAAPQAPDRVPSSKPAAVAGSSPLESSAPAPAATPRTPVSTDVKIDSQHRLYYQFVDVSTGSVEFEIPPEALRAIGESLNLPLQSDSALPNLDVKS